MHIALLFCVMPTIVHCYIIQNDVSDTRDPLETSRTWRLGSLVFHDKNDWSNSSMSTARQHLSYSSQLNNIIIVTSLWNRLVWIIPHLSY